MNQAVVLRLAKESDLEEIGVIMNHEIQHGTANYDYEPKTIVELNDWFKKKSETGDPLVVAESDGQVVGYGTMGRFREKIGYRYSFEHSVYVHNDFHGNRIGGMLITWLIDYAIEKKYHSLIAGIDASNEASIRFHKRYGFEEVARFKEVGYKFNRWLDLVFMQKMLP